MNRREFLMSIGATLIPRVIRVNTVSDFIYLDIECIPLMDKFIGGSAGGGKSELIAIWETFIPKIRQTFERDNKFYSSLRKLQ